MNRQQRRESKKNTRLPNQIKLNKAISYCKPLDGFLDQIENNGVMFDGRGNPLLDMNEARVMDKMARNEHPFHAVLNLNIMTEIAYQVTYKSFCHEDIEKIGLYVDNFRRKILNRLKSSTPLELKDVAEAREMHFMMVKIFSMAPIDIVNEVKNTMNDFIELKEKQNKKFPTFEELRAWLSK